MQAASETKAAAYKSGVLRINMEAEKAMQELVKLRYTAEELERELAQELKRRAAAEDDAKLHVAKARSLERELEKLAKETADMRERQWLSPSVSEAQNERVGDEGLSLTPASARSRSRGGSGNVRSNQGKLADGGMHRSSSSSNTSSLRTRPARSLVISSPTLTPRRGRSEEHRRLSKSALTGDRKAPNSNRLHPR